ncbi:MAG: hypothetical protein DMF89_10305 [Acidobacteria bacterium]|nr:MAG: hypothetical protein DMF89_10305 [Acidobacteriota bacterium]
MLCRYSRRLAMFVAVTALGAGWGRAQEQAYTLRPTDVLELTFPFTPEFNHSVTIQPDGQSLPEVTELLRSAYSKFLHDPVINIELKDFEKPYFLVGGEVGRPGKFDLRGATTATEAVTIAGGLKDSAKHSQVLLFRRVPDGWAQTGLLDMKKMLATGNLAEDAQLHPGDFLYVPKNTLSKVTRFIPTASIALYAAPGIF